MCVSRGFKGRELGAVCYRHVAGSLRTLPGTTEVICLALGWGTHMPSLDHGSLSLEEPITPSQMSPRPRSLL